MNSVSAVLSGRIFQREATEKLLLQLSVQMYLKNFESMRIGEPVISHGNKSHWKKKGNYLTSCFNGGEGGGEVRGKFAIL